MRFDPGGVNVIPGRAEFTLEVRHLEERVVRQAVDTFAARLDRISAEEGCRAELELLSWVPPAPIDATVIDALEEACKETGRQPARMWSGAGHDAAVLSRITPVAMLFVRCAKGISHNPAESVAVDDVAVAIDVVGRFLELLALSR